MIGLLTHLSTALGRSEAESAALLNAFVRDVHQTVRTHGEAAYPGLGSFRLGPTGMLEFRPDASLALVVNHRFAGLTPVPVQTPAAAPAAPGPAAPAGWMPPTAPLVPPAPPIDSGFGPGPGVGPTFGNAPSAGTAAPFPPPADLPPIGAYTSNPVVEPLGGYGYVPPASSAYNAPPPGGAYVPPVVLPVTPTATFAEAAFPPPEEPVTVHPRPAAPRRPSFALVTLTLLVLLGLLAWYLWATAPPRSLVAGTPPPATIVAPSTPDFSLPPPDSVPPESGLAADSAVPAPTTPAVDPATTTPAVDPGASALDPAPPTATAPSTSSAPSAAAPPSASAAPSGSSGTPPAVRRSASPYTPYTGSSRPDRTVRRSPPRRAYTGRTYRSSGGSSRRTTPATARPTTPAPAPATTAPAARPAVRPTTRPAPTAEPTYQTGLTPELETMLLGEEMVQPGDGWTLVVRGEPTESEARIVAERYRTVGYRVNVFEGLTADGRTIFRVAVGQFPTVQDALRALRTLAGDAFPADAWMLPLAADE